MHDALWCDSRISLSCSSQIRWTVMSGWNGAAGPWLTDTKIWIEKLLALCDLYESAMASFWSLGTVVPPKQAPDVEGQTVQTYLQIKSMVNLSSISVTRAKSSGLKVGVCLDNYIICLDKLFRVWAQTIQWEKSLFSKYIHVSCLPTAWSEWVNRHYHNILFPLY